MRGDILQTGEEDDHRVPRQPQAEQDQGRNHRRVRGQPGDFRDSEQAQHIVDDAEVGLKHPEPNH
ncbi:hypothetical protein D1872_302500 [compost metagenome]